MLNIYVIVFMHNNILLYSYRLVSSMICPRTFSSRKVDRKSTGWGLLGRTICGPVVSLNVRGMGALSVSVSVVCHGMVLGTKFLLWLLAPLPPLATPLPPPLVSLTPPPLATPSLLLPLAAPPLLPLAIPPLSPL